MSQRGKRQPNRTDDGPIPAKRRKCRPPPAAEEEETTTMDAAAAAGAVWTPRPLNDLKISSIYNRSASEAPAELFRKDLISAMKLPDSEPLSPDEYWVITDQWKQEWERGVQVPVNPDSLPEPTVTISHNTISRPHHEFKLPKSKYIRITKDEFFTNEEHYLSNTPTKAEKACSYDLDDCDIAWLQIINGERACMGLHPISEDQLERVIEELEIRCWEKVQTIVKTEEGLGIEYDENVICDVCRSPDSEEGNEMVFCDSCNICVHQACYGITTIPSGSWLCRTCALSLRPECVLCPNKGGAMKCTRSGQKWAHVSCALWIPEVSIGCVERMEPITKISSIPQSRWALICVLCRERVGACIQCSVKTCKTAYHVTCAFKHGLEMKAIIEDENADDGVKLRSYCQKHSVTSKKDKSGSASEDEESKRKKRKDMTSEEKNQARAAKLQEIEAEFDKHVSVKDITQHMDVDTEGIQFIYNYWKLKRKAGFNKPLLPPKSEDVDILSRQQEQADLEKMKMFVQLRQDLERVRNLCYMVSRREKLSRTFFRMREQTFHKQAAVLSDANCNLKGKEVAAVIEANHGPSIYDRLYSQPGAEDHSADFDVVLARIAGIASPRPSTADEKTKTDLNGLVKCTGDKKENPYDRLCFNGASRHRSNIYGSMSSDSETDRRPKTARIGSADSSTEEEEKPGKRPLVNRKSGSKAIERKRSKKSLVSKSKVESSSEEEDKPSNKSSWHSPRSRTLRQMEREMGDKASASDDSDELLIPVKSGKNEPHKMNTNTIYSDSDSEVSTKGSGDRNESKSPSNTPSDSQQHVLRTKAAMKEFSAGLQPKVDKSPQKNNTKPSKTVRKEKEKETKQEDSMDDDFIKDKENVKSSRKKEYDPTDLIVPQRQAAKKATESIRCSQGRPKEQIPFEQEALRTPPSVEEPKVKAQSQVQPPQQKMKHKTKDAKESKTSKDGKSSTDIYDFEKESSDAQEILAYVPQRQAAKKAAAHIKSGMTKPGLVETEAKKEPTDGKGKKESEIPKSKKEQEQEKPKGISKPIDSKAKNSVKILSSSSSSSSSGDSSSTSSESEDDVEEKSKPPPQKAQKKDKKASIEALFSNDGCDKKSKCSPDKKKVEWPFPQHTSSSSDTDSDSYTKKSRTKSLGSEEKSKPKVVESEDRKGSNSKLVAKKFKKAPDKKLKTSDGRPELEFQPPIVERDESSRTKGRGRKHGPGEEDRIRNAESRPGDISSAKSGDSPPSGKHSRTPQKDQHEARKRKSSDVDGGLRSDIETPPRKERVRSIEHIPPAAKKTDKKIEVEKESLGSQLEREISERKAERETPGKKTSKVTLDRLFEKRDKKINKLFGSRFPEKPAEKDTKKDIVVKEVEKRLSVKQEIQIKEKQKPFESNVKVEELGLSSKKPITKDKTRSENEDAKKSKNKEVVLPMQNTQSTSIDKETVIKKVEKPVESLSQNEKEDASRRTSVESGNGDEDNSKKKTKPMPKCKKEALRILDGGETNVQEVDEVKTEAAKEVKLSEEPIKQDDTPIKLPEPEELPSEPALKELAAPVLSPEQEQAAVVLAENKTATHGSFTLMPQLEKACALDLGNEFQVPEQEPLEAKKITSRSSSLSVPNYPQRSIFSPQQPSKDPPVSELFDFENDILAVDETVNDDGFSIARDSEEIMRAPPLTFSFSSEFLFKEDSKEDSARETHLLVEKLRLEYAKKTTTNVIQPDTSEAIAPVQEEPPIRLEDITEEKPEEPPPCQQVVNSVEPSVCEVKEDKPDICNEPKPDMPVNIDCSIENKLPEAPEEQLDKSEVPPYVGGDANGPYDYHACGMQLEVPKVSIPGREKLDRSNSAQADERWVPPSVEFMPEQHHSLVPTHHYESLPPAPSPYTDLRNRTKWTESEMIPERRSSSSSASSTSSSSHREEPDPNKRDDLHLPPHNPSGADIASYQGLHPGIPPYITDAPPYHTYSEASPFVGSVALFPPPSCAQMPYPSPGGLYPPFGPPFPTPLLAPVPKPPEDPPHMPPPCSAAFTSSSINMALTAAMVSPSPSVATPNLMAPAPSPVMQHSDTPSFVQPQEPIQQLPLPMSPIANHHQSSPAMPPTQTPPTPSPAPQTPQTPVPPPPPPPPPLSEPHTPKPASSATAAGKKIPTKPTRTSARFISQQGKSPGKSPRQQDTSSGKTTSQNRMRDASGNKRVSRAMYNQPRGGSRRGRGRGRGQHVQHFPDSDFNTIHSKLVGTVYDLEFDDDSPSESVENLRAMRERRRSTDMHERKHSDTPFLSHDSPPPHPMPNSKLRSSYNDLRPPSPLPDELLHPPSNATSDNRLEQFPDVVQPLLPGPVDMRTYSSSYEPAPTNNPTAYHNHLLGTFATAAAEQHVADFVEDLEKELHSALQASKAPTTHSFTEEIAKTVDEQPVTQTVGEIATSNNKVSLSDSRNQLKVKIKGPFLDANYAATSAMQPQQQQPTMPPLDVVAVSNIIPAATTAISSAASSSGTSNLRRMRKKELLRQYCSQDMNMDDPAAGAVTGQATAPAAIPPVNRNVITIPKAVASMTTIPTREDYKAVVDANMEKKRRKEKAFASSLRHFDLPGDADDVGPPERRRSVGSTGSNASQPDAITTPPIKRRGRPPKSTIPASGPIMVLAPKLKIKIGNSIIGAPETDTNLEEKKLRVRPPKKRLTSVQKPTVEELKRESMKFRRMIMADFDEAEKKQNKLVTGKRRKQKQSSDLQHQVQIITADENVSAPKLIIRLNKRSANNDEPVAVPVVDSEVVPVASAEGSEGSERTSKVTPIRLKLARCQEGYVMKTSHEGGAPETVLPESEGCEVR